MSIKLYNGFLYSGSLMDFLGLVDRFRPYIIEEGNAIYDRFMDASEANGLDAGNAWRLWTERRSRAATVRDPAVDTEFSVTLFPLSESLFAGLTFTDHSRWHDEFLNQPGVRYFAYWDNSDPDPDVSVEQWAGRRAIWDSVLTGTGKTGVPSAHGFTITISDPQGPFPKAWRS